MQFMTISISHSPFMSFPLKITDDLEIIKAGIAKERAKVEAFDPDLIILFGSDHYGGHQMYSMPSFCVGIEATAVNDVGATPGKLIVPRDAAVKAVNALRNDGVDVAVSYAMDVDHGFSVALETLTGGVDKYPVLPIFVSCVQPPFVPYKRARHLGEAVGRFAKTLPYKKILFVGTGGLSHDPAFVYPPIDAVTEKWKPYILKGKTQTGVPQEEWMEYIKEICIEGAKKIAESPLSLDELYIREDWDKMFLKEYSKGDMTLFDAWSPEQVMADAGIGAVETLTWIAAASAMKEVTSETPTPLLQQTCREIAIGFGIADTGIATTTPAQMA